MSLDWHHWRPCAGLRIGFVPIGLSFATLGGGLMGSRWLPSIEALPVRSLPLPELEPMSPLPLRAPGE